MQRDNNIPKLTRLCANTLSHTLFPANNQAVREKLAPVLLQHVIDANWLSVEIMLIQDPLLMFEVVDVDEVNDLRLPAGSKVTPLDYICMMRDRYAKDICKLVLKPEHQAQYSEIVRSYPITADVSTFAEIEAQAGYVTFLTMVEHWLTNDVNHPVTIEDLRNYLIEQTHQLSQQNQIYSLHSVYWVLMVYYLLSQRAYHNDPLVTNGKRCEFWQKIDGFVKRFLLPKHMLKQMQAQYRWYRNDDFAEASYPIDCRVRDWRRNRDYINPDCDDERYYIFGENYSIARGEAADMCIATNESGGVFSDLEVLRRLDFVRLADFVCDQLELEAAHTPLKIMGG